MLQQYVNRELPDVQASFTKAEEPEIKLPTSTGSLKKQESSRKNGFSSSHVWMWELGYKESRAPKNWCFWTVVLEKTLESPWTARRSNQSILKEIGPGCLLEGLMLKWNTNTLATWCEELTHLKRPWCWERLRAGREGDDSGWDGWMASLTQWIWVWVNSVVDGTGDGNKV